ncbi:MAG: hypothetical protein A2Y81_00660 [Nitrospirae bacterium RBG_13_43_8]|nr:MAG: hypothetical protein A2Y81_00660 [Nitrospirae bacterium RBG_13_43_8]
MKNLSAKSTNEILNKIEVIEKEVLDLKLSILKQFSPSDNKVISLKGVIKGVDITDMDIASAKQSLYSNVEL